MLGDIVGSGFERSTGAGPRLASNISASCRRLLFGNSRMKFFSESNVRWDLAFSQATSSLASGPSN